MSLRGLVGCISIATLLAPGSSACGDSDCLASATCAGGVAPDDGGTDAGNDVAPPRGTLVVTATAPAFARANAEVTIAIKVDRGTTADAAGPIRVELEPVDGITATPLEIPPEGSAGELTLSVGDRRHGRVPLRVRASSPGADGAADAETIIRGAPGSLDTSFGEEGVVSVPIAASEATGIVVQSDGKIALAGRGGGQLFVARLLDDGALDPSFATTGSSMATVPGGGTLTATFDLVETTGGALALGFMKTPEFSTDTVAAVIRWTAAGAPDTSFGAGTGSIEILVPNTMESLGTILAAPGGGLFVGGRGPTGADGQFVASLTNAGALDTTWGASGRFIDTGPGACLGGPLGCYTRVVVRDTNGELLSCQPRNDGSRIHRIAADGKSSPMSWNTSLLLGECGSLALDPTAPGFGWVGGSLDGASDTLAVMRLDPSGSFVDPWGNTGGDRFAAPDESGLTFARRLSATDNNLVIGAEAMVGGEAHFAVARLTPLGQLDTTFATKGYVTVKAERKPTTTKAMAVDSLGRIIVAGTNGNAVAARLWP